MNIFDVLDYMMEGFTGKRNDGSAAMLLVALVVVLGMSTWVLLGRWTPVVTPKYDTTEEYRENSKKRLQKRLRGLQPQPHASHTRPEKPILQEQQEKPILQEQQEQQEQQDLQANIRKASSKRKEDQSAQHTVFETSRPLPNSTITTPESIEILQEWKHLITSTSVKFQGRHERVTIAASNILTTPLSEIRLRILQTKVEDCRMCQLSQVEISAFRNEITTARRSNDTKTSLVRIKGVRASGEHPPTEMASNLLQSINTSKWLDMSSKKDERWISFELETPTTHIVAIHLTSANDCPERDPVSIIVEGREKCDQSFDQARAQASTPTTSPITAPDAIFDWKRLPFSKSLTLPLAQRDQHLRTHGPSKIMLCHDMMGGYTESDRYDQGTKDMTSYSVHHWHLLDIFVYFSHHLVTIPPVQWINASHKHGVKCYGTFITEWETGAKYCHNVFFANSSMAIRLADALVNIAVSCGFDGWLINIENHCDVSILPHIRTFLKRLKSRNLEVSWYDSVSSIDGNIRYQNELNSTNKTFFQCVDSFFTNYRWNGGSPRRSAAAATSVGRLPADVFMGCDVFGRGTYGGGGWNVDVALRSAFEYSTSLAIFAPGWVYEHLGTSPERFVENNMKFWSKIEAAMQQCSGGSRGAGGRATVTPIVTSLPLLTNFSVGSGPARFAYGTRCSSVKSWSTLSEIDPLPSCWMNGPTVVEKDEGKTRMRASIELDQGAFQGCGTVLLKGILARKRVDIPLYTCRCETIGGRDILVSLTHRTKYSSEVCLTIDLRPLSSMSAKSTVRTLVLRGFRGSGEDGRGGDYGNGNGNGNSTEARRASAILATTATKAFLTPLEEYYCSENANADTRSSPMGTAQTMADRATKLRKEGKSTATIAAILRFEREQQRGNQKETWTGWKTRTWKIPASLMSGKRIFKNIGVTCVSGGALEDGNLSTTSPYCTQLGELCVRQLRPIIPGAESPSVWSLFKDATLELVNVLWSSSNTVCFTVSCSHVPRVTTMDYYYSTDERPGWTWIGRSIGARHMFRVMEMHIPQDIDMIVVGAIPFPMEEYSMTHKGSDLLHLMLEEGPRAVLLLKNIL